jgi:hypothetical protein
MKEHGAAMKKRVAWVFVAGLLLLVCSVIFINWTLLFPPALPRELAILVPPNPLLFLQGSQLKTRVDRLTQRAEYQTFLDSELLANLNQTEWWPMAREEFLAFWKSLIIDPMHIIGHEMAIGLYASDAGEILPRAILIGDTDQVARIAERLMYGYDRLTHQIGITFYREYQQYAVYQLQTPTMLWPLYYAVVGKAGLISTSLPLLYETIEQIESVRANHADSAPVFTNTTVFTAASSTTIPDDRIITGYIELEGLAEECRRNPLLRALGMHQWQPVYRQAPHAGLAIEEHIDHLMVQIRWFSAEHSSEGTDVELAEGVSDWQAHLAPSLSQPLVMTGNIPRLQEFIRVGQQLFPQWAFMIPGGGQAIYGEGLKCTVSERLIGLLYMLPEMACVIETERVQESRIFLDGLVQSILVNTLPPLLQNRVTTKTKAYRDSEISHVELAMPLVKQQIVHYTVMAAEGGTATPNGYTIVSNADALLKRQIDDVAVHPEASPYRLDSPFLQTGFLGTINPVYLAGLLQEFSRTPTFAVLAPPQQLQAIKQNLPFVQQSLELLPPLTVAGGTVHGQLVLEFRIHHEASGTSAP